MPVADDGRQMPLPEDPLELQRQIAREQHEFNRTQLELLREHTRFISETRELVKEVFHAAQLPGFTAALNAARAAGESPPEAAPKPKRRHMPRNTKHRTWRGFVEDMQRLERIAMDPEPRGHGLKDATKQNICQFGPDAAKTITRTMTETYGLKPDDWPPSTWDANKHPPLFDLGHLGGLAAAVAVQGVFDLLSDGKLDGIVHWCSTSLISAVGPHISRLG